MTDSVARHSEPEALDYCPYCGAEVYTVKHGFALCGRCRRKFAVIDDDDEQEDNNGRDRDDP